MWKYSIYLKNQVAIFTLYFLQTAALHHNIFIFLWRYCIIWSTCVRVIIILLAEIGGRKINYIIKKLMEAWKFCMITFANHIQPFEVLKSKSYCTGEVSNFEATWHLLDRQFSYIQDISKITGLEYLNF